MVIIKANFTVVYGFEPDLTWLGEDIGFGENMRPVVLASAALLSVTRRTHGGRVD